MVLVTFKLFSLECSHLFNVMCVSVCLCRRDDEIFNIKNIAF